MKKKQERSGKQGGRWTKYQYTNVILELSNMQSYDIEGRLQMRERNPCSGERSIQTLSEKEKDDDVHIWHLPSYWSDSLNKLIKKLNQQLDSQTDSKKHPHLGRTLGSPRKKAVPPRNKAVPPCCKKWMIRQVGQVAIQGRKEKYQRCRWRPTFRPGSRWRITKHRRRSCSLWCGTSEPGQ